MASWHYTLKKLPKPEYMQSLPPWFFLFQGAFADENMLRHDITMDYAKIFA